MKLTDYIAIYGALLSTFVFIWNLKKSSSKIIVTLIPGTKDSNGHYELGIYIDIKNLSPHVVYITSASLLIEMRSLTFWDKTSTLLKKILSIHSSNWCYVSLSSYEIKTGLPKPLESQNSHMIFIPNSVVYKILDLSKSFNLKASVQDALWRNKISNTYKVDPKTLT